MRHARWVFEPRAGTLRLTEEQMRTLAERLPRRRATPPRQRSAGGIRHGAAVSWQPGDDVTNPTVAWPDDRPRAVVGRLDTVTNVAPGTGGACDPISFMTLEPARQAVELSDDPTLQARAAAYAVSLSRRLQ